MYAFVADANTDKDAMCLTVNQENKVMWVLDTGATDHLVDMTPVENRR
jgi:hypothetical protein